MTVTRCLDTLVGLSISGIKGSLTDVEITLSDGACFSIHATTDFCDSPELLLLINGEDVEVETLP